MAYVVYDVESTRIATPKPYGKETYRTEAAAKAAKTRMEKGKRWAGKELAVAEITMYRTLIEKMVEKTNLMSGKKYMESVNTPNYCSPSSEAYWSM
jgi:hypothetical protein